ncbi:MAG TPA: hypothetical protein VHE78_11250 [Gemmatimonadaceae bacterium]|nr:hypothetical protein [Gemmatimonadaceae bacterium]
MPDETPTGGREYLVAVREQEARCRAGTERAIRAFGRNLPVLESALGSALSSLEQAACCYWGCTGGEHVLERLIGRAYSLACASHRLMETGRYDEALLVLRSLGELANLLTLFATDRSSLDTWLAAEDRARRRDFIPVKVRLALEAKNTPAPMDQDLYDKLCQLTVHPTPETKPGMHNPSGLVVLGGHVQIVGVVVVLNELARVVGCSAICASSLLSLPAEKALEMRILGADLLRTVGPLTIETVDLV